METPLGVHKMDMKLAIARWGPRESGPNKSLEEDVTSGLYTNQFQNSIV